MRSEHDSHVVLATIGPLAACLAFFIVWQSNGGGAISLLFTAPETGPSAAAQSGPSCGR